MNAGSPDASVSIRPLEPSESGLLRDLRLRALSEAPSAFGSTYAREAGFDDAEWTERARSWASERCATWVAFQRDASCGIVACALDRETDARSWIVSMWVDPEVRRRGVGRRLIDEAIAWSRRQSVSEVRLHVTSNNPEAARLYESIGFRDTGDTMAHGHMPSLCEIEMRLELI
ncbi:MAG: GNAT family N-acetyltransferase [Planctomycetota bacterium]